MEYNSPSTDRSNGLWASPRGQMDNSMTMDDPFNSFSELMNFDTYVGWCTSPSAADQMLASFALSAGYTSYDLGNFSEQFKNGFAPIDRETVQTSVNAVGDFGLPADDENGSGQERDNNQGNAHVMVQRSLTMLSLAEKMLKALSLFKDLSGAGILAQVWVPIKVGDTYILSTYEQPYLLDQVLSGYREVSRRFTFSAEMKPGHFPDLPGRVFTSKVPEWTSNVAHYNKGEYLRIDHALRHEVRGSIALPIFEDDSIEKSCCAVLELVTMKEKLDFSAEMDHVCRALQTVNLKSTAPPRFHKQPIDTWPSVDDFFEDIFLPLPEALEQGKKAMVKNCKKKYKTAPITLSHEAIEAQYGKTMAEAAAALEVSLSTLKRKCKAVGISEWQGRSSTKIKVNNSSNQSAKNEEYVGAVQDSSAINKNENTLTIKAKYKEDTIKFHLCISEATFIIVEEKIGKKFNLTHGTYKLNYLDEDEEWILLASDEDMSDCMKSSRILAQNVVKLLVLPIPV